MAESPLTSIKTFVASLRGATKQTWCPFASRVQDFSKSYADKMDLSASPRGVLHTTEGTGWPEYGGGSSAPHFTIRPNFGTKTVEVRQHFPINLMGRSLKHTRWPDTNRLNTIQIELVGTCDTRNSTSQWFVGNWPDWYYDGIAKLMRWVESHAGVARSCGVKFIAYPASYGNNGVRLNAQQWVKATGWLGHQHVDQNEHGDPGTVDITRLLAIAPTPTPTPAPPPVTPKRPLGTLPVPTDGRFGKDTIAALQRVTGTVVDGLWGPNSIKAMQRFTGVTADGIVGPITVRAMQRAATVKPDGLWTAATTAGIQRALNARTFKRRDPRAPAPIPAPVGKIAVDGSFGPITIKALQQVVGVAQSGAFNLATRKALQKRVGVAQDGVVGPVTIKAMQKRIGAVQDGAWGPNTTRALQTALNAGRF